MSELQMSLICRLSKFVVVPIWTEWLTPWDFLTLDSSLCNSKERQTFRSHLVQFAERFLSFFLSYLEIVSVSIGMMEWVQTRLTIKAIKNSTVHLSLDDFAVECFKDMDASLQKKLMKFLEHMEGLKIDQCSDLLFKYASKQILPQLKGIKRVLVVNQSRLFQVDSILSSVSGISQLQSLILDGYATTSDKVLIKIIRKCSNLTELTTGVGLHITGNVLLAMAAHKTHLRKFCVASWEVDVRRPTLMFFMHNWTMPLEDIRYSLSDDLEAQANLPVRTLLWYCGRQLSSLQLYVYWKLNSSEYFEDMTAACPNLTSLFVNSPPYELISTSHIASWQSIVILRLQYVSRDMVHSLLSQVFSFCICLQEFAISARFEKDSTEIPLTSFHCCELTSLTLECNVMSSDCESILRQSVKLRNLILRSNQDINLAEEAALRVAPYMSNLQEFVFSACLSQICFQNLLHLCHRLRSLTVPWKCRLPVDGTVYLRSLLHLRLEGYGIDGFPLNLYDYCPNLISLSLKHRLSYNQLLALVENLPGLRKLDCDMTKQWFKSFQKINRHLTTSIQLH